MFEPGGASIGTRISADALESGLIALEGASVIDIDPAKDLAGIQLLPAGGTDQHELFGDRDAAAEMVARVTGTQAGQFIPALIPV